MVARLVLALVAALGLASCSGGAASDATSAAVGDDATVTYAFHDSSVPPPYHRSITLTVTRDSAHIVVDSYGDVLADRTAPTPPEVWATLMSTLPAVQGLTVDPADQGCTGGTGISLAVVSGNATPVSLDPQFCAGSNASAETAINDWIAPARALFPATDVLAPVEQ